ncbi:MAG TPA: SufD family Fe-S cluster assembly protein, partial [Pseudonocardiaceae bacterium]|nr:SufD family Fe-S cluster assembly protein [Pseudonocardiaceae bacterium]
MTTTQQPTQHGLGAHSHGSGVVPASTRADRQDNVAVPQGREENWRFTPMKRLGSLVPAQPATGTATVEVSSGRDVIVDSVGRDDERIGAAGEPTDYISRTAFESFAKATVVTIPRESKVDEPVMVTVTGPGVGQTAYGHLQVRVEQFAQAVVVLDFRGSGSYADNLELVVGDGAKLTVVAVHDWADDAVHVTAHQTKLGRDATLRHTVVTLGGDL